MTLTPAGTAAHVAAALEAAHTREDVGRYVELFAPSSTWITSRGVLIVGREELRDYLTSVMPGGLAGGSVTYRARHAVSVGDAVAVIIDQEYRQSDGTLKEPGGQHRHTYVVAEVPDGWAIVTGQNTTIAAGT